MNVLGKVDLCQVGVFLAFATETLWTWIDGELFLPEPWFVVELADERTRLGIPPGRQFATKVEVGWQMIERVLAAGVPFEVLLCDDVYGRSQWLRHHLRHHLALMILAGWFITQTKVEWALQHSRDGRLADELGVGSLPAFSVANVRELLQAVMPLPQLSPEQARRLVVKHLVDRTRFTRSRLKAQLRERGPT